MPDVTADDVDVAACDNALAVANKEMDDLHVAATAAGYTCFDLTEGAPLPVGDAVAEGPAAQTWQFTSPGAPAGTCGFTLTKFVDGPGVDEIYVSGLGATGCGPTSVKGSTNAGNAYGLDIFEHYAVRIAANGVFGTVNFKVYHLQGGQNPKNFNVTIGANQVANNNAIKAGFDGTNLGLTTRITHADGPVLITNAASAQISLIVVDGLGGQDIEQETSILEPWPAVGPWSMALLFGLLLSTGYWVLRRRQRSSASLA